MTAYALRLARKVPRPRFPNLNYGLPNLNYGCIGALGFCVVFWTAVVVGIVRVAS